jgi:zinc transporter 1/2/3
VKYTPDIAFRYCVDDAGEDIQILVEAVEEGDAHSEEGDAHSEHDEEGQEGEPAASGEHCHFHAGVE